MNREFNIDVWEDLVKHPRIGEVLLQRKKITISQLDESMLQQSKTNLPLGEILVNNNFITKDDLIEQLDLQNTIDNILLESINELKSSAENE